MSVLDLEQLPTVHKAKICVDLRRQVLKTYTVYPTQHRLCNIERVPPVHTVSNSTLPLVTNANKGINY